ncbi:MAG TPA: FHA domain-containing protein [Chloroflexia bacterium]|nr:FHA domain-containing protein [Chloroflexia bacterium]
MQRGTDIGSRFFLKHGQTAVGRNPDNDIVVDEVAVSRYHAVLRFDEVSGEVSIMDLGSTNGVSVNNIEIKSGTPYKLKPRDTVFIGRAVFNVQIRPDNQPPTPKPEPETTGVTRRLNLPNHYQYQTGKLS